ncbi:DEAD/DEAH box helicase [Amycolatopsis benzoatilytica]|uniref:DEAD/DEAH box helicase n=1 Tax=Amycolatopsis benzoatilytica TaxID=346045 RepID=UPI00037F197E|nr:DEAD/DEAH box helicase [Amycolatopsis benzoatilytica]
MATTVHDILEAFRALPVSNRERGDKFERLMVQYLKLDPLYAEKFSEVWMWADWPGRAGKPDTGIDIVAEERETGGFCAIQCKFYEPDHYVQKSDIDSFFTASGKAPFTSRIIISTTDKWGQHAEDALDDQRIPVSRVGLADIGQSPIRWDLAWPRPGIDIELRLEHKKTLRPHQQEAVDAVFDGFAAHDRGKLIMACGTGKTFTSLKVAERLAAERDGQPTNVLFLVPSISLLSQTLREWTAQTQTPMRTFAVCSDTKVGKRSESEDIGVHDLAFPATTDTAKLVAQVARTDGATPLTVIFSTYQSITTVSAAQQAGFPDFDLVICDEAHRTTGVTLAGQDESQFVKVHDNTVIKATKRLYMTATPRLFDDNTKTSAQQNSAELCSMDDEALYGPEFHRLGFGKAVAEGLLTDYKVLILTVDEKYIATSLQSQVADENNEINLDDAVKIVGCWNGLSKRSGRTPDGEGFAPGSPPMRRAVAFSRSIKESKKLTDSFAEVIGAYDAADEATLRCEVRHVDGSYNALQRNVELDWLKADAEANSCRILSNARCLSEGVDVPDLDAVLFLNPRNSVVDVVQSVGRVMRKAEGKDYGYIILPVGVPTDVAPDKALSDNKRYKVVWQVLQALRAHDDRFNATVNKIELNKRKPNNIMIGTVGFDGDGGDGSTNDAGSAAAGVQATLDLPVEIWRDAIYAKIVTKVGERAYWENWAKDVAAIAERHVARITALVDDPASGKRAAFEKFLNELRSNINPGVSKADAIDMLAQHLITKPVFDALFAGYDFSTKNPVSQTMQKMLDILGDQALGKEVETLESFYASVRVRAEGIDNHEGRQKVITELYEKFFKTALPKAADAFGIVYTPIPIVDFILRATNQALERHLGTSLSAPGVQIIDPFTGTGTFIVRLLQSGLIKPEDLLRKYTRELHANEILLLAYYIAAVNIEAAFHQLHQNGYTPFDGIVLTDTFQLAEDAQSLDAEMFPENNKRVKRQKAQDIRVVIGNPPYSVGQDSVNDNNQNQKYYALDRRIADTYVAKSAVVNKNKLYDSYIRAIRWASDRIKTGVVCFVSNGGYIDGTSTDGLRKSLAEEFDAIYCYNLRGNQRTAGEQSRKEGGKVFGSGSRSTVAILLLVKGGTRTATTGTGCELFYRDIGDYLTREQKLDTIASQDLDAVKWQRIVPSPEGDWINQRDERFATFRPLAHKDKALREQAVFAMHSSGLNSARDAWVYNFSEQKLNANMQRMIDFYNGQVDRFQEHRQREGIAVSAATDVEQFIDLDPRKISWNRADKTRIAKGQKYTFDSERVFTAAYRPFTKQRVYFNSLLNDMTYQLPRMFPNPELENVGFYVTGTGSDKPFSVLATDLVPDLAFWGSGTGRFFPRYTYEKVEVDGGQFDLLSDGNGEEYTRVDNITDDILSDYRKTYGSGISKDDIFYYVYGLLHSPNYRTEFAADLKKMLPRIPKVKEFKEFTEAGRELVTLHVGYEAVAPYQLEETTTAAPGLPEESLYRVQQMAFGRGKGAAKDRSRIVFNSNIVLSGIPEEAYSYTLGARSAIEWIMERYQVKTDKASGIVNDPNEWSDDPRYILDLLKRIVTVSLESVKIIDALPVLDEL